MAGFASKCALYWYSCSVVYAVPTHYLMCTFFKRYLCAYAYLTEKQKKENKREYGKKKKIWEDRDK